MNVRIEALLYQCQKTHVPHNVVLITSPHLW